MLDPAKREEYLKKFEDSVKQRRRDRIYDLSLDIIQMLPEDCTEHYVDELFSLVKQHVANRIQYVTPVNRGTCET